MSIEEDERNPKLVDFLLGKGLAASAGAVTGKLIFTNEEAEESRRKGEPCILCREYTSADDIAGLKAAEGVLTMKGGLTSHAAVIMRGMGKPAVTGASTLIFDKSNKQLKSKDEKVMVSEGEMITVDGTSGLVFKGEIPTIKSTADADFRLVLSWCDKYKRMMVLANVDTIEEAEKAVEFGAEGIGLCRIEHMLFQEERIRLFRRMLLSETLNEKRSWLEGLAPLLRQDFLQMFRLMKDKQVTVRLIDPPLHEFLPNPINASFMEEICELSHTMGLSENICKQRVMELQEMNPMLGYRGCRLAIIFPETVEMQTRALIGKNNVFFFTFKVADSPFAY
jgi:pyruvate, orthophosphate dikinase